MLKNKKILLFFISFCLPITSCIPPIKTNLQVMPEAIKTEIQGIKNDMGQLKDIISNNAQTIENLRQQLLEINNTVNNSGTIKYSGAGYVVLGTSAMAIIFLGAIFLSIKYFLKASKTTNMLGLVVQAVKNSSPEISDGIKAQINKESNNGGKFNITHKKQLSEFVKNN